MARQNGMKRYVTNELISRKVSHTRWPNATLRRPLPFQCELRVFMSLLL